MRCAAPETAHSFCHPCTHEDTACMNINYTYIRMARASDSLAMQRCTVDTTQKQNSDWMLVFWFPDAPNHVRTWKQQRLRNVFAVVFCRFGCPILCRHTLCPTCETGVWCCSCSFCSLIGLNRRPERMRNTRNTKYYFMCFSICWFVRWPKVYVHWIWKIKNFDTFRTLTQMVVGIQLLLFSKRCQIGTKHFGYCLKLFPIILSSDTFHRVWLFIIRAQNTQVQ